MCFTPKLNPLKTPLNPLNVVKDPVGNLNPKRFFSGQSPTSQLKDPLGAAKSGLPSKKTLLGG